jgi:hypothetical protein
LYVFFPVPRSLLKQPFFLARILRKFVDGNGSSVEVSISESLIENGLTRWATVTFGQRKVSLRVSDTSLYVEAMAIVKKYD